MCCIISYWIVDPRVYLFPISIYMQLHLRRNEVVHWNVTYCRFHYSIATTVAQHCYSWQKWLYVYKRLCSLSPQSRSDAIFITALSYTHVSHTFYVLKHYLFCRWYLKVMFTCARKYFSNTLNWNFALAWQMVKKWTNNSVML